MERSEQANIEHLIVDTVSMLCRNSISYSSELRVQGTLGITVDASRVIFIQLNKCFKYGAEDHQSDRNASAHVERAAAAKSIQSNTYSSAGVKRPRITSVINCTRKPVGFGRGRGRGRVPIPPVQRMCSRPTATGGSISAQGVHHPLAFPGSSKLASTQPSGTLSNTSLRHVAPSQHFSPHAGHVAPSFAPVNDVPQQLPAKLEAGEMGQSSAETVKHQMSSDIICIESDDDTETAAKLRCCASTSMLDHASIKSEGQSHDALQTIVHRAVMAAQAGKPAMV